MKKIVMMSAVLSAVVLPLLAQEKEEPCRMVVANLRSASGDTFSWCGKNESTAMWASTVVDKLTERFTQTRKFTMIDRKFDAEVKDEIARLSDKNAAKGDVVRLGRRLGTDYMVVGDVKFGAVQAPGVNPLTGQALQTAPQRFAEISYRVIQAPTGEIKWADTVTVDSGDVSAGDLMTFVSASADLAARRIVEGVVANLLQRESAAVDVSRHPSPSAAAAPLPPATSVRGTGNGGIVTPF